jgi:RNA polymerase sigma-70 factor (ECF subfamily)
VTPSPTRQLAAESQAQDAGLMERVRRRDPAALQELYDRHAGVVYGLGLRILRDSTEAQDLVQDVFLHLWRRSDLFDAGRGAFLGWLVSLARNRAIDRVRAKRTRDKTADSYGMERETDTAPRQADPNEAAYVGELRTAVARALTVLPDAQRTALELAYFGGLSHTEIAERLETPLGTVKARIRQGMIRLRDLLGEFADVSAFSPPTEEGT